MSRFTLGRGGCARSRNGPVASSRNGSTGWRKSGRPGLDKAQRYRPPLPNERDGRHQRGVSFGDLPIRSWTRDSAAVGGWRLNASLGPGQGRREVDVDVGVVRVAVAKQTRWAVRDDGWRLVGHTLVISIVFKLNQGGVTRELPPEPAPQSGPRREEVNRYHEPLAAEGSLCSRPPL